MINLEILEPKQHVIPMLHRSVMLVGLWASVSAQPIPAQKSLCANKNTHVTPIRYISTQ